MTDSVIIKIVNQTDTERRIAYNYEMQMCRTGKINGVNSQISNILKQAGVDTSSITKDCTFTVDPYSYEITVDGCESSQVTEESKMKYEAYHQVYSYTGYGLDKLEPVDYIPV